MSLTTSLDPLVVPALREFLLALADDEFILGHRHSEWTGLGPDIESDVALSSIAQEEMGHARLFYQQVLALAGRPEGELDALVFDRPATAFRNAVLVERPNGDWGYTVVRLVLYELADGVRLGAFAPRAPEPLPALARTLAREEKYHRMYAQTWLTRLARATADSHEHVRAALEIAWAEARGLFEPPEGEARLLEGDVLAASAEQQEARWRERVADLCAPLELPRPDRPAAAGGRRGVHSPDLTALLEEITSVRRLEPGATW